MKEKARNAMKEMMKDWSSLELLSRMAMMRIKRMKSALNWGLMVVKASNAPKMRSDFVEWRSG